MNAFQLHVAAMLAGLALDFLIGDPEWFPHPVRLIGAYISRMERILRARFPQRLRRAAVFLTASTVGLAMLTAWAVLALLKTLGFWPYFAGLTVLSWTTLSCKCLAKEAHGVRKALGDGLERARHQVARIVGRDTEALDAEEIVKATVETVAENTTDGVISPMLYLVIGGPVLAMGFKAASTLDSMVGYMDEKYRDIGWCSARLDDILNYIPARLCAVGMCLCSCVLPGLDARNAARIVRRDHANHASPNCAWSEAAAAGALHIQLGGTHLYFGKPVVKPTIGDDDRRAVPEDIGGACRLLYAVTILSAALPGIVALALRI